MFRCAPVQVAVHISLFFRRLLCIALFFFQNHFFRRGVRHAAPQNQVEEPQSIKMVHYTSTVAWVELHPIYNWNPVSGTITRALHRSWSHPRVGSRDVPKPCESSRVGPGGFVKLTGRIGLDRIRSGGFQSHGSGSGVTLARSVPWEVIRLVKKKALPKNHVALRVRSFFAPVLCWFKSCLRRTSPSVPRCAPSLRGWVLVALTLQYPRQPRLSSLFSVTRTGVCFDELLLPGSLVRRRYAFDRIPYRLRLAFGHARELFRFLEN